MQYVHQDLKRITRFDIRRNYGERYYEGYYGERYYKQHIGNIRAIFKRLDRSLSIINHIIGLSGIIYICNMEEIIPVGLASTRHAGRDIFPEGTRMCPGNV